MTQRKKAPFQHGSVTVDIGVGNGNFGRIKSLELTIDKLGERLANPIRDNITQKQYLAFPKAEQDRRKSAGGFWLGGPSVDNKRKNTSLRYRSVVTLDIDEGTTELLEKLIQGKTLLNRYCFFLHTTRKHSPERPRFRIVILLEESIATSKYAPLARILASYVDKTMDAVDDVSFRPAQMMFWPTVSSDAEYVFLQNEGHVVDGDAILEDFGDWQDWTKLPFSGRQGRKRPSDPNLKAENPLEKKGLPGAFCRAYPHIMDAIEKYLPGIYIPGDEHSGKPRLTFTGGSTTNGAVIEDDGLFLYSHHTSDPVTDRLVNAFDLVRIHLFGDRDGTADPFETKPVNLPSWKAMEELCADDEAVKRELQADRYDIAAMFNDLGEDPDDDPPGAGSPVPDLALGFDKMAWEEECDDDVLALIGPKPEVKPKAEKPKRYDSSWMEQLEITEKGAIKSNLPNETRILQNDPRLLKVVELNEFTMEIVTRRPLRSRMDLIPELEIKDPYNGDTWGDFHDTAVRMLLEAPNGKDMPGYGLKVSDRDLEGAIVATAMKNRFHPVRDLLEACAEQWDSVERVETLFVTYLGTPDTPYARGVARCFSVAAVARIFEPGHKFDNMPIFEGGQGKRKSTFIKVLAMGYFGELEGNFSDQRKCVEQMQGCWIMEMAELSSFSRSEILDQKAFMSKTSDKVRLAYARRALDFKRQCVFMGSTNESQYLMDLTGNRRYWPIEVTVESIDTDALQAEVRQIWGEAVHIYRTMREKYPKGELPLFLRDGEGQEEALEMQESRRITTEIDGFSGIISCWLDQEVPTSKLEGIDTIFEDLGVGPDKKVLRETVCLIEVWEDCLGNERRHYKRADSLALAKAMRLTGWKSDKGKTWTKRFGPQQLWRRTK